MGVFVDDHAQVCNVLLLCCDGRQEETSKKFQRKKGERGRGGEGGRREGERGRGGKGREREEGGRREGDRERGEGGKDHFCCKLLELKKPTSFFLP